jgi:hypothetical protein
VAKPQVAGYVRHADRVRPAAYPKLTTRLSR